MQPRRLSILGTGLLGGSMGMAVRARLKDCRVVGYGHRPAALQNALACGAIDEAFADPLDAVRGADWVILCTPVGVFGSLMGRIAGGLAAGAIVTDVGSTKRSIVEAADALLPAGVHFVGSHPMAGSEKRGVEFARADLFDGALCITTPTPRTEARALEQVEEFWRLLGMHTLRLGPQEHDRLLADASHLPHAAAAALVAMQEPAALELCGKGFADMTRIAGGDSGLWRDILLDNRDNVRQSIAAFIAQFRGLDGLLERGDSQGVEAWLRAAAERRRGIDHRRG